MSDAFYNVVWQIGNAAIFVSSSATVLNAGATKRGGAYILASNHLSPYDVAIMMRHAKRKLDFVSIVEVFRHPLLGRFYGSMNAFPLDRMKPDSPTVRTILDRLARGRVVAMFPEGRIRSERDSVLSGGAIRPGIGRLAVLAGVPIVPCVVLGSAHYGKATSWLPLRRTRYGIAFGEPLSADVNLSRDAAAERLEEQFVSQLTSLAESLRAAMRLKARRR